MARLTPQKIAYVHATLASIHRLDAWLADLLDQRDEEGFWGLATLMLGHLTDDTDGCAALLFDDDEAEAEMSALGADVAEALARQILTRRQDMAAGIAAYVEVPAEPDPSTVIGEAS